MSAPNIFDQIERQIDDATKSFDKANPSRERLAWFQLALAAVTSLQHIASALWDGASKERPA